MSIEKKIDELTAEVRELQVDLLAEKNRGIRDDLTYEQRIQVLEQDLKATRFELAGAYKWWDEWQDKLIQAKGDLLAEKNRADAYAGELRRVRAELLVTRKELEARGHEQKKA